MYHNNLRLKKSELVIFNLKKGTSLVASQMNTSAILKIRENKYGSSRTVQTLRYDILLEMPCHGEHDSITDYKTGNVSFDNKKLPILEDHENEPIRAKNNIVKRFRSLVLNCNQKFQLLIYQIAAKTRHMIQMFLKKHSARMKELLLSYKESFSNDIRSVLPLAQGADHEIIIGDSEKLPHKSVFELPPAELVVAKEYIAELLKKEKSRQGKSPHEAALLYKAGG